MVRGEGRVISTSERDAKRCSSRRESNTSLGEEAVRT